MDRRYTFGPVEALPVPVGPMVTGAIRSFFGALPSRSESGFAVARIGDAQPCGRVDL